MRHNSHQADMVRGDHIQTSPGEQEMSLKISMDHLKETCVLWVLQLMKIEPITCAELHLRLDQHL